MKKLIYVLFATLLISGSAVAQNCLSAYPHEQGTKIETCNYEPNGKKIGKSVQTVVTKSDNAIVLKSETFNIKEDTVLYSVDVKMTCKNGKWYVDMSNMLDPTMLSQYKDMQVVVDADEMEIPEKPSV